MTVTETSKLSYKALIEQDIIGNMEARVFRALINYPDSTDLELKEITGLNINRITGRRNMLEKMGCVVHSGYKPSPTRVKTKVKTWKVPDEIHFKERPKAVKKSDCPDCPFCKGSGKQLGWK